ncbi:Phosphoribosylaminoimidazolesuccinocarboxamide synthase [Elusimicrobium minutum Pei191]|uniref:Phosphoribosylaminoimidazole-succinocarboxamide synthase n=1 Tax=Elusimicrobium minutum (strain Pei191) TaxID=445932 RepID=B2KB23_ELUMP|nr:phosphoribosylaminoimidazolesuccinocarboxamide synthase [Elusimicrobium minutum]ACC97782.1 Phosphoribosylaminoimidazolesuccinocarboxamide synthase [Elusimicrobium minutum Pei191]
MKHVYEGKTKTVFELENGNYLLKFKDDVTGTDGVFDPGANTVGLSIEGMGKGGLRLTTYFFEMLQKNGIKTHYVKSDIENNNMEVLPAAPFGNGIEVICRFKAVGSFMRRYGQYAKEGQDLNAFVEVTLKDDERGDPPITKDALSVLGILTNEEYESLKEQTQEICKMIKAELAKYDCELYDIKLEFGRNKGEVILIDEISGGNMRVYKNGKTVAPLELVKIVLGN